MHNSGLNENYQSAYKQLYSIGTALQCAANDIQHCVDENKAVLYVQVIGHSGHFFVLVLLVFE